jgi:hypothetical protein
LTIVVDVYVDVIVDVNGFFFWLRPYFAVFIRVIRVLC